MALDLMSDFQAPSGIDWRGDVGVVKYGNGMVCTFYMRQHHSPQKSEQAGRPVFEDRIYARIHPPGERLNIVDRPASEADKRNFPREWQQFVTNAEQIGEGTPIEMLHPHQPSVGATLKAHGVHTIEKCAELSGVAIESIGMGGQKWHNDAVKYIAIASKGVGAAQFNKALDERDSEIRVLKQQLEMMRHEIERLSLAGNVDQIEQVKKMVMQMAGRPQYASSPSIVPAIDLEQSMINANHPTQELSRKRRGRPKIDKGVPIPNKR